MDNNKMIVAMTAITTLVVEWIAVDIFFKNKRLTERLNEAIDLINENNANRDKQIDKITVKVNEHSDDLEQLRCRLNMIGERVKEIK